MVFPVNQTQEMSSFVARRVVDWHVAVAVAVAVSHDLMFITGQSHRIDMQS